MNQEWENRIHSFWQSADENDVSATLTAIQDLIAELEPDDPRGLFELASAHDFLGLESEAIPLYEKALALGLDEFNRQKAIIQLASSLRNVGKPEEAIFWLETEQFTEQFKLPAEAFLALAKFDAGIEPEKASLSWLDTYPTDALFARSIKFYFESLP
ncbi:MAG: tetratricopeptide repeat protein [Rhodoluna sp.]